ncbi:hypothetical protein BE221DRAFT_187687 [Ostreococcus tauri]|uniref:Uncharacterized protein n=1 Tax=Ostreococcus tauri TaxID=70448 RepID=A0A1Y5I4C3_OSTTA|nr:hypothetical protein BE221DRAFT_187687 [Ostreococcus tauri]
MRASARAERRTRRTRAIVGAIVVVLALGVGVGAVWTGAGDDSGGDANRRSRLSFDADADETDDADDGRDGWKGGRRRWMRDSWRRWALSVCVPIASQVRDARRRLRALALGRGEEDRVDGFADPSLPIFVVGATTLLSLEKRLEKELWAWFVDSLGVSKTSPGRAHLESVLASDETTRSLDQTYDELRKRFPRDVVDDSETSEPSTSGLNAEGLIAFSDGIRGSIWPVMERSRAVKIQPASEAEHTFLLDHFDLLFPRTDPLDREAFHALAKLILVRRIIKALVKDFGGLGAIRQGLSTALVVDVRVIIDDGVVFRVHTVAPKSDAVEHTGRRLSIIAEAE